MPDGIYVMKSMYTIPHPVCNTNRIIHTTTQMDCLNSKTCISQLHKNVTCYTTKYSRPADIHLFAHVRYLRRLEQKLMEKVWVDATGQAVQKQNTTLTKYPVIRTMANIAIAAKFYLFSDICSTLK